MKHIQNKVVTFFHLINTLIKTLPKGIRIALKVVMWFFVVIFAVIFLVVVALQFPQTQNFLTGKAVGFLKDKLNTEVSLGEVNIGFPKSIVIKDFYIEDLQQDTLLYAQRLAVDLDMWGLISNEVQVNSIELERVTGHISRTLPDTTFNYSFIMEAFASDTTTVEDTTSSPWDVSVYNLELQDIYLTFQDELEGSDVALKLGFFEVEMDEFNLNENLFMVDFIELKDTWANVALTPDTAAAATEAEAAVDTTGASPLAYQVGLNTIDLGNIDINYQDNTSRQQMKLALGQFIVEANGFDLQNQMIDLASIQLSDTEIAYIQGEIEQPDTLDTPEKMPSDAPEEAQDAPAAPGWTVNLGEFSLAGNSLRYENLNEPELEKGMDFNHMLVSNLNMKVEDILYSKDKIAADLNHFSFQEKSGFILENFTTQIRVSPTLAALNDLLIKTPYSEIKDHVAISYPSLSQIGENLAETGLDVNLDNTVIGFQDIMLLQPSLAANPSFNSLQNANLVLNTKLDGTVGDLNIANFSLQTLGSTVLSAQGQVSGLPDMDKAYIDLQVNKLATTRQDLQALLPPGTLSPGMNLPANISINADFKGYLTDFDANANVNTSLGNLTADVQMNPGDQYNADLSLQEFQLGTLLGQDSTLGSLSLIASIDGAGLSPEDMKAELEAVIQKVEYNQYQYNDININGAVDGQQFAGTINIDDENIKFDFDGMVNMNDSFPDIDFLFDLHGADLQALNLYEGELSVKAKIEADFTGSSPNDINGDIGIRNVMIVKDGQSFPIDSLIFASINEEGNTDISLDSEFFSANFKGTINLGDLPQVLERHIDSYYDLKLDDENYEAPLKPQNFEFEVNLKDTDLLTEVLVPDIEKFVPGRITGSYNSAEANLEIQLQIPELDYAGTELDTFNLFVSSDASQLFYALSLAEVTQGDMEIENFAIVGGIANDLIETALQITDSVGQEKYLIGGEFTSIEDAYRFHFVPESFRLNYEPWQVTDDNFLQFGGNLPLFANNLVISNEGQSIAVNSLDDADSTLQIALDDFNLTTISRMIQSEEGFMMGLLNGEINLATDENGMAFTSDLEIRDFAFQGDTLGTISLQANNSTANRYTVAADIKGNGNDVELAGYYESDSISNSLNLNLDLNNLNLASIEGFTAGQLTEMQGALRGNLEITGNTASPNIIGALGFYDAEFILTALGTHYTIQEEEINFTPEGISFQKFQIIDNNDNTATIDGPVLTENYSEFEFDLDVTTRDFLVLNTTEDDLEDAAYYGTVLLDSDILIRGDLNQPVVDMRVSLGEGTDFNYVLLDSEPATAEREGIVEFVDKDMDLGPIMAQAAQQSVDTVEAELQGFELSAIIEIEPEAEFRVVIDPAAGDFLALSGTGTMNFSMDPSGKTTLTGRYEIAEGAYQMTFYDFVKREFSIRPGSSITWAGDILEATVDITAINTVRTSPYELVSQMLTNPEVARQQMLFDVYLNMEGELLEPEISFGIELNEEVTSNIQDEVSTRLLVLNEQESELNKQVFALLILQRFIAEDPFDAGAGGGAEAAVRGSVSKILTQQLNKLAENVDGVQLQVDVQSYEDYSSGTGEGRTDLELGLSKSLFDERITVSVGGNVNLEGDGQQSGRSDIVGDISIRYRLTEDGRYVLEAFRQSNYEGLLDGLIIRTGFGLIFTRDYDRFSELFNKSREEWEEENN